MPHDVHSASGRPGQLTPDEAKRINSIASRASLVIAAILVTTKLLVWHISGSVSLLASAADSALDLTASLTVFFAIRYAAQPADQDHRYGHGKAEAAAGMLQAVLVAISAALLLREGVVHAINPVEVEAEAWALGVMVLSMALTLLLIQIQSRTLAQTGSVAIEGDRAHYFTDLGSNLAVIVGLAGTTFLGWVWLDGVVAIAIALWLFWTAWEVGSGAFDQIMDKELPDEDRDRIAAIAADDSRIIDIHDLRTRAAGPIIHIQFHMALPGELALRDAHAVLVTCEERLLAAYPAADIIIHPDPHGEAEPHGAAFFKPQNHA